MTILQPTPENLAAAVAAIRAGELVGMPTETVYGVAADATRPEAVIKTFAAKQRPADNPLIVHVAHLSQLEQLVTDFPETAQRLAAQFWPGPLTLILPKRPEVPHVVTGGRETVAIRIPNHPVALRLIDEAGVPISAPSANLFMGLSPTRAEDMDPILGDRLAMILDGGACEIGLESSVVDLSGDIPRLLRPGGIPRQEIEESLGVSLGAPLDGERKSPGLYLRHYAPRTPVRLVKSLGPLEAGITFEPPSPLHIRLPQTPREYGVSLYAALHRLDAQSHTEILIQSPPQTPAWEAVWDRLKRVVG